MKLVLALTFFSMLLTGVVNQRKDLETFFDTEVVRLVLNRLRSRGKTLLRS